MAERPLLNFLKKRREVAGWSQLALAERVGVSRQAIIAIEAGRQVPSTSLSLLLSRALDCTVDDLFQLAPSERLVARVASGSGADGPPVSSSGRVAMGRVEGRWVAHRLSDRRITPADGIVAEEGQRDGPAIIEPLTELSLIRNNVLVSGCAPLLGIFAERTGRRYRDTPVTWLPTNSGRALDMLRDGTVHVAGVHLIEEGACDRHDQLRKQVPGRSLLVVNLTRWRQGLVVPAGNPLALREVGDLCRPGLRVARREPGSGAETLLSRRAREAGVKVEALSPGPRAWGHVEVVDLVRCGAADVGISIEGAAIAAGLDFIPLSEERFELIVPRELATEGPASRLLAMLGDGWFRSEASRLPGYDGSLTGQVHVLDAA